MFTYSHMLPAVLIARALPNNKWPVVLAGVTAAAIPDIPLMAQMAVNGLHGLALEHYVSPLSEHWTAVLHSIPIWGMLCMLAERLWLRNKRSLFCCTLLSFGLGWLVCHIGLDLLTHKDFVAPGPDYLFPYRHHIAALVGFLQYRDRRGIFLPKWWEVAFDLAMIVCIVLVELHRRKQSTQREMAAVAVAAR